MTQSLESLVKTHKELKDQHATFGENCMYTIFADDLKPWFKETICWQPLRAGLSYFDAQDEGYDDDDEDADEDYIGAEENRVLRYLVVDLEPHTARHRWGGGLADAYRVFFEHYMPMLMPGQTVDAIIDNRCFVLDFSMSLNVDCLGGLLVGFRNLSEQRYYQQFNIFAKAGFKPSQVLYLTQCFRVNNDLESNGDFILGAIHHNVLASNKFLTDWSGMARLMKECFLFDPENFLTGAYNMERTRFQWSLGKHMDEGLVGNYDPIANHVVVNTIKQPWGGYFTSYGTKSLIEQLKKVAE